jgi:hypothetical protein
MMHGYVVEGSPEKHRGSPEVPVIRDGRGISFSRGRAFQKGRRRLPVPLDWRESPPACSYPSAKPTIRLIATSSIAKRAWAVTRTPPERIKRLKGGVSRDPRRVPREVFYEGPLGKRGPCGKDFGR